MTAIQLRLDQNLFAPVLACTKSLCTLGEISDVFRDVFGVHAARDEV